MEGKTIEAADTVTVDTVSRVDRVDGDRVDGDDVDGDVVDEDDVAGDAVGTVTDLIVIVEIVGQSSVLPIVRCGQSSVLDLCGHRHRRHGHRRPGRR